ncbi:MAG: anaerobic ribonucleoside-triphosphate reductase, partial [Actinomycetota bacterium]
AHMIGDIHLHDLGFIVRPYTYMGDSVVLAKKKGDFEKLISIKQFYDGLPFEFQAEEGVWIKQPISDLYVLDRDEKWTKVIQLTKKQKKNKRMYFVRTSDGKQQVVTDDHPMITTEGIKPCELLSKGDRLITQDYQFKNYGFASINLVEEFAAAGVSGERYNVCMGQKIPLRIVKRDIYQGNANPEHYEGAVLTLTKGASKERAAELPLTSELGWVLGFYIAEGHQSEHSIAFTCEGEGKAKLVENLRILNIPYEQKKRANRIVINDTLIRDLFINVWRVGEKAREKSLPPDIINYSPEFIKGVVAGIIDGDGSIDNASISIRVSSATLVNQLMYVLKMLGFEPSGRKPQGVGSIREHNGREIVQKYPIWCVAFGKKADIDLPSLKYKRTSVAPKGPVVREAGVVEVTHVQPVDIPDEYIYDITTESHTFMCNGIYSHNCGGHSLEYIKKYGLALPNITSVSKPAKHPEVLIGHMVKMASTLQSHYAGAVGWEAVNVFFAPYIVNFPYDKVKQLAQMLIFEFNQLAGSRGAQVTFTDFNLYYGIARHFENTPALGPGGKYMKKKEGRIVYYDEPVQGCLTYKDFEKEANLFLRALFDIYLEGDVTGKTFVFPKPLLHINDKFFETPGHDEFLDFACKVASKQGITYFVFDRGDSTTVSQCCRLKLRLGEKDLEETKTPEKMRFSALQNVTVNLPRIAYKARGNDELLFTELNRTLDLVARAHVSKKKFISDLIDLREGGPLYMFSATQDGSPYLRMDRLTYLCGLLGLNELVQAHLGEQLHESDRALKFGLKIVSYMNLKCRQLSERYGIKMVLEESPAESAAYRLAKLDMKYFPEQTSQAIKGTLEGDNYYYTNSIHLAYDAPVDYIERVEKQSLFHPLVEAGSIIHIWLGENEPDPQAIKNFVTKTYRNTQADQIVFSPEFTVCEACRRTTRGLHDTCSLCGSDKVYGITRIVGYFSKVPTWNKGKASELKDRIRTDLSSMTKM